MANMMIRDLAALLGATLLGDDSCEITGVASLDEAEAGDVTFLANPKYADLLQTTRASAVIVGRDIDAATCCLLQVDNPDLGFMQAVAALVPPPPVPAAGVHPSAVVSPEATLGTDVCIGPGVVVQPGAEIGDRVVLHGNVYVGHDVRIGPDSVLYPGVVVYHRVQIGSRVILQANAVIGSDGFGFVWDGSRHVKVPQVGIVVVEDDVEIGACTVVDRARFGKTVIGVGTKLDNLIQIAHNVQLGQHCAFAAQVGISGSTQVGNGVMLGGQTGVAGHIRIGDGAQCSARTGVNKSVPGGEHYTGYPARPHKMQLDEWRALKALPRLRATVRKLEERIATLEREAGNAEG